MITLYGARKWIQAPRSTTGMVPKHCEDLPDIQVTDDMDKVALMEQLDREENSGPQLSDVVHYMRKVRAETPHTLVLPLAVATFAYLRLVLTDL